MSLPEIAGHELQDLIGSGRCGAVYRSISHGRANAVKVFSSMAINRKALAMAISAVAQIPPHRSILPIEDYNFEQNPYFCAMPLIGMMTKDDQGHRAWHTPTLETVCQGVPVEQAWTYIYQLADGVAWLHKYGIPHGNLRPCNVLLEGNNGETHIRITDIAQGWVGSIHHFDLEDHFVHLCPEQIESPEGVFAGYGPSWDVYSFGILAYRLLTGTFPRGGKAWKEQLQMAQTKAASGLPYRMDAAAILSAIRAQPRITWPTEPHSKWDERRRNIIERALDLNASARWADMREVVREFEILESDYLLEEAREQTVLERKKQGHTVRLLQVASVILLTAFLVSALYAAFTLHRAQKNEGIIARQDEVLKQEISQREEKIATLIQQRDEAAAEKKVSEANLQHSQHAVDQLLTQMLQAPASSQMEAQFSKSQLQDALRFCLSTLPGLEKDVSLDVERLRAYGNIGQIYYRLHDHNQALIYLQKARTQAAELLKARTTSPQIAVYQQWFGRYSLLLSDIHIHRGERSLSLALLRDATASLQQGLAVDPQNRLARNECARAWMEYGLCSLENGDLADAENALGRLPDIFNDPTVGSDLLPDEQFLLARSKFAKGLAQRDAGRMQDALTTLIDAVQEMGQLVLGTSPRNQEQALLLAEAYTELAELIAKTVGPKEAREAFNQAVPILLELNRLLPEWQDVKYLLARNYSGIALLDRDAGQNTEAVKKKQDAIELLNEIIADEKDNVRYAVLLARVRGEYAELMSDMGKATNALPIVKQAVTSLEELLAKDPKAKMTPERIQWEIQLAQMYGVLGHTSQTLSKKADARTAFKIAAARWEKLAGLAPGDEVIQQGLKWAKDRLAKLK